MMINSIPGTTRRIGKSQGYNGLSLRDDRPPPYISRNLPSPARLDKGVRTTGKGDEMMPVRITLSRAKGWRMPENTVKVDRSTKWGNPFVACHPGSKLERPMTPELSVATFRMLLEKEGSWSPVPLPWPKGKIPAQWTTIEDAVRELRGKNLACWCKQGAPCHGDVLLELANK